MIYLKIILLKIARFFAVLIGNIIRFFRGNKNIDLKDIKKIIFNRKDRIGDAVVTKPFIILFSKYIKEELSLDIDIEVECSKYNDFVFRDENEGKYYKMIDIEEEITNSGISILSLIKQQIHNLLKGKKINYKCIKDCVYVDLVGNTEHILQKQNNHNFYFIGGNLFLNNFLLDYSLNENYVSGVKINLIQSYINLISGCFQLNEFEDYINKNIDHFYDDYNDSNNKEGILISVGNKEYRNFSILSREKIIKFVHEKYPDKEIEVIDDNSNVVYNKLKKIKDFNNHIKLIENNFTLNEFRDYAKNFELLIGIDGGGFNYIRTVSDSITLYTIGNYHVWSIFTGKFKYGEEKLNNGWYYCSSSINGKYFGYIYKKSIILPTYDNEILKKYFNDIII